MTDWDGTRRAWDAIAPGYFDRLPYLDVEQPLDRAVVAAFAEQVRTAFPTAYVLDAGCGAGRLTGPLRDLGLDVAGVDLSPGMIAAAKARHPDEQFQVAELAHLPFDADSFDGVIAWYSLINCDAEELPCALGEIARVLRPGGYFLTGFQAGTATRTVRSPQAPGQELPLHLRTPEQVSAALDRVGLTVIGYTVRTARADSTDRGDDQAFILARLG